MHLLLSNAKQIFDIIATASGVSLMTDYASSACEVLPTVAEELACELQIISRSVNSKSSDDLEERLFMVRYALLDVAFGLCPLTY